ETPHSRQPREAGYTQARPSLIGPPLGARGPVVRGSRRTGNGSGGRWLTPRGRAPSLPRGGDNFHEATTAGNPGALLLLRPGRRRGIRTPGAPEGGRGPDPRRGPRLRSAL